MGKFLEVIVPTFAAGIALALAMFRIGDNYPPAQAPIMIAAAGLVALVGVRVWRERKEDQELRECKWVWRDEQKAYVPRYNLPLDCD
ncbi:hypothetical protein [Methylosinus sp. LW4]|uniref:hypothetical protein n=1 Tax=Methylosinus sp. LW4 TaxID=136993 RepID=UPI00035DF3AD|nr:hypothetical protein [Methylosinus sp. LW4]